jgi:hypothetical protein
MITRKTYFPLGLPATESEEIFDPALAYVQPLMVSRSGMVFSLTDNDALLLNGGLFYQYSPSLGVLRFGIPFNTGEDIEIVYKTI